MRHDLVALKSLLLAGGLFAAALLITWVAISTGSADLIVPSPEATGEGFLKAMKAHRYQAAHEVLASDLREQVSEEDLRDLGAALEARQGPISEARGRDDQQQGDRALATAVLRLTDGKEEDLTFPLIREAGLWKIESIQPLLNLAT